MTTHVRAIETMYNGYRFRSRLEARWAVFFDTLGVPYEYEKEGYELGDGVRYLPDFWLPDQHCWVEIKGEDSAVAHEKADRLAAATGASVYVFVGGIVVPNGPEVGTWACEHGSDDLCNADVLYAWCECPFCRRVEITIGGDVEGITCGCFRRLAPGAGLLWEQHAAAETDDYLTAYYSDRASTFREMRDTPRLMAAYLRARQARFEHGETPKASHN